MVSLNKTTEITYKTPSFWQTFAQSAGGVLGQLTGMGGYCGMGGYGIGSYGGYAGTNVWSQMASMTTGYNCMAGMGGYCSDASTGAVVGNIVGSIVSGLGMKAITGWMEKLDKPATTKPGTTTTTGTPAATTTSSSSAEIKALETKASTHLTTLGLKNLKAFDSSTTADQYFKAGNVYDKNIESAKDALKECIDTTIPNAKTNLAVFEAQLPATQPTIQLDTNGQPTTESKTAVEKYNTIKSQIEALKNEIEQLEKDVKADGKLGKAVVDAESAKEAQKTKYDAAIKALIPIKNEYDELIKTETPGATPNGNGNDPANNSASDVISALNEVDGNGLTRTLDGSNSDKDKLNKIKDAISKFENKPSSLKLDDVIAINTDLLSIDINDKTEATINALTKANTWSQANNTTLVNLESVLNGSCTDASVLTDLANKGFIKKIDTNVSGTKRTIYKMDDQAYYIENNQVKHLTKIQNGNIFHKAKYQE